MFEAIVSLCLVADPGACRDVLLPGYEAPTVAACEALLGAHPPGLDGFAGLSVAQDPACAASGAALTVSEAAPGVFVHLGAISDAAPGNGGDVSNSGFVIGETGVAVIDSGGSRAVGEALYRAIRQRTDLPIRYLVLTHMHPDHVLGASVFAEAGARIVGHDRLARALADREQSYLDNFGRLIGPAAFVGARIVPPDDTVDGLQLLDLGGRTLGLRAWPNSHTATDVTVTDVESGILFTGDLVFDRHAPALDGSITGWIEVLSDLRTLPVTRIVPGHGGPLLDWPAGGEALERYLEVLARDTRAAIARGDSLGEAVQTVGQDQAGAWDLFDLFNPRNATVAYTELEWE